MAAERPLNPYMAYIGTQLHTLLKTKDFDMISELMMDVIAGLVLVLALTETPALEIHYTTRALINLSSEYELAMENSTPHIPPFAGTTEPRAMTRWPRSGIRLYHSRDQTGGTPSKRPLLDIQRDFLLRCRGITQTLRSLTATMARPTLADIDVVLTSENYNLTMVKEGQPCILPETTFLAHRTDITKYSVGEINNMIARYEAERGNAVEESAKGGVESTSA